MPGIYVRYEIEYSEKKFIEQKNLLLREVPDIFL